MIAKDVDVLVSKITRKRNSKTNLDYLALSIGTLDDGSVFNVLERNEDNFKLYEPMEKYNVDMSITSSQYGVSVGIDNINASKGNILE